MVVKDWRSRIRTERRNNEKMRDLFFQAEVRGGQRVKQIDIAEFSLRPRLLHRRSKGADYLIDAKESGRRGEVLEIDDVVLDLRSKKLIVQRTAGEDDDSYEIVILLKKAETFAAN
jgi:hypothetical protein